MIAAHWRLATVTAVLGLSVPLTPVFAQAPATKPAAVAAVPVPALPALSCQARAGAPGRDPLAAFPAAVDGAALKRASDVERLARRAKDQGLAIKGGDFSGQKFDGSLDNVCFVGTKLVKTDWSRAQASGVGFIGADLTEAKLAGAKLPYLLIREATLKNVDASKADFSVGRLDGGWAGSLEKLRLDGALLRGFSAICGREQTNGCPFDRGGISLRGVDFTGANVATFQFWDADLAGAILSDTHVGVQQLGQMAALDIRGPVTVHSARRFVRLTPEDYRIVREGIIPAGNAAKTAVAPARSAASCAGIADRTARFVCLGGPQLQQADKDIRDASARGIGLPGAAAFEKDKRFCADLSDDLAVGCLVETYRKRVAAMGIGASAPATGSSAPANTQIGGAEAVIYAALPVSFTPAFRGTPQFTRILPVLLDASPSIVKLRSNNGETIDIDGRSISGCSVTANDLSPDSRSGWYGIQGSPVRYRGRRVRGKPVPIVRFGESGIEFSAEAQEKGVLSCPAGAKFDAMRPVRAPIAVVQYLWGK